MSLAQFPERWPLAPAHDRFAEDLRQLRYRCCHDVYRLLFIIRENLVHVTTRNTTISEREQRTAQHVMTGQGWSTAMAIPDKTILHMVFT